MDPGDLKKNELINEIKARGFTKLPEEVSELRFVLRKLIRDGATVVPQPIADLDEERQKIGDSIKCLEEDILKYPGRNSKLTERRLRSRLCHIRNRLERLDKTVGSANPQDKVKIEEIFRELSDKSTILEAKLETTVSNLISSMSFSFEPLKVIRPDMDANSSSDDAEEINPIGNSTLCSEVRRKRFPPVYLWGCTFNGDASPNVVLDFLERIEELRIARGCSKSDLFLAAIDVFVGPALTWFRSIRRNVSDWDGLVSALKAEFLPPYYDDTIWQEIRERKQSKREKVGVYIAAMINKFGRLTVIPDEAMQIRYIKNNLQQHFRSALLLQNIQTTSELISTCRLIEIDSTPSTSSVSLLSTSESANRKGPPERLVSSERNRFQRKCWNCGEVGHPFFVCKAPIKRQFCFKCGHRDTIQSECPVCNPNSKN